MVQSPTFDSWNQMEESQWLANIKRRMANDEWPTECVRCRDTESVSGRSIRLASLDRHKILSARRPDYLILGGILDNVCNSACQSCNENLSTKIGSLKSKDYPIVDNSLLFDRVPTDRILEIDINGGEPTASPRYQQLIKNLPAQIEILRVNTNGGRILPNLQKVLDQGIKVIITISLDGTDRVHDYVRWPIRWPNFLDTVGHYRDLKKLYPNLELQAWTTLHALNLGDFENILTFAREQELQHDWAYLEQPWQLSAKFSNCFTRPYRSIAPDIIASDKDNQSDLDQFITSQDRLRNICIKDFL